MRSVQINTERTWRGGEQQVVYLARGLIEAGDETRIVCQPGSPLGERAREAGIPCDEIPMRGEGDVIAAWRIGRLLRRVRPDVVHVHTPHAHTLAQLAAPLAGWPRLVVSKRTDFSIFRNSFFGLNRLKYNHGVHRYAVVSEAVRDVLVADGIPAGRISVVRSGVDPARWSRGNGTDLRGELGLAAEAPVVGNIGNLYPHKGQRTLVEAAPGILEAVPEARIVIVGDGELAGDLRVLAEQRGVDDRVIFTGFREDIARFLSLFRVFVMPSHQEGLGTAVLDAFALRLPVVATRAGGIPEMIRDGENGILVPPKDPDALAGAVIGLLRSPERARALGEAGLRTVREEFSVDRMVADTRALYLEVMGEEGGADA